jgi:Na+/proline symporter
VALGSLIIYPSLADLQVAFPGIPADQINDDLAYSAMLTHLPSGLKGLIVASLIAAFMSTISTHLNWGSSYVVNDFYARFVNPGASDKQQVQVGRMSTVLLMVLAAVVALYLESAKAGFDLLLQIGAGTGLIFILRWFWWRISAYTEIAGMVISFLVAIGFFFLRKYGVIDWKEHEVLIVSVVITTVGWLVVTFLTPPTNNETLKKFCLKIRPHGKGWKKFSGDMATEGSTLPMEILCMAMGCVAVYSALFATGFVIYSNYPFAIGCISMTVLSTIVLFYAWKKIR